MLEKLRSWFEGTVAFWAWFTLIVCIISGGVIGSGKLSGDFNVGLMLFGAIVGFVAGAILVIECYGFLAVIIIMGRNIERMRLEQEKMK